MKTKSFYTATMLVATLLISSATLFAQPMNSNQMKAKKGVGIENKIPNLTTDQKAKIQAFRIDHMKVVTPIQNAIKEKKAHLNTITSTDKPDMVDVNKTIDEISKLNGDLMKSRIAHQNQIRSILTDEQKVYFNAHIGSGKGMMNKGNMQKNRGMRNGNGMGMNAQRQNRGQFMNAQSDSTK